MAEYYFHFDLLPPLYVVRAEQGAIAVSARGNSQRRLSVRSSATRLQSWLRLWHGFGRCPQSSAKTPQRSNLLRWLSLGHGWLYSQRWQEETDGRVRRAIRGLPVALQQAGR